MNWKIFLRTLRNMIGLSILIAAALLFGWLLTLAGKYTPLVVGGLLMVAIAFAEACNDEDDGGHGL